MKKGMDASKFRDLYRPKLSNLGVSQAKLTALERLLVRLTHEYSSHDGPMGPIEFKEFAKSLASEESLEALNWNDFDTKHFRDVLEDFYLQSEDMEKAA